MNEARLGGLGLRGVVSEPKRWCVVIGSGLVFACCAKAILTPCAKSWWSCAVGPLVLVSVYVGLGALYRFRGRLHCGSGHVQLQKSLPGQK